MLALSYPNEASLCATALTWTPNTAEQSFKRSGRDYARSCKKSRNPRRALERKSTGSANWKSSRHQSFAGTNFAIEPPGTAQTAHGRAMPSVKRRASKILDEYGAAQSELIGKAVVLTDGKA